MNSSRWSPRAEELQVTITHESTQAGGLQPWVKKSAPYFLTGKRVTRAIVKRNERSDCKKVPTVRLAATTTCVHPDRLLHEGATISRSPAIPRSWYRECPPFPTRHYLLHERPWCNGTTPHLVIPVPFFLPAAFFLLRLRLFGRLFILPLLLLCLAFPGGPGRATAVENDIPCLTSRRDARHSPFARDHRN